MPNSWTEVLRAEQAQPYFQTLQARIAAARAQGAIIYPPADKVFEALRLTPFEQVKVVILGQDPYHGAGQAHGLAFSVPIGTAVPPSLANIYKELATDIDGFQIPQHGHLQHWAEQGVLLLNTVLTVPEAVAHAHASWGWETYTDAIIRELSTQRSGLVFMLWGKHAQKKGQVIDRNRHLVLEAPHPSPLSVYRGFYGCRHFSQANAYLTQHGQPAINWQL